VSQGKQGGRFSYLTSAGEESAQTNLPQQAQSGQETNDGSSILQDDSRAQTNSSGSGGEGRSRAKKSRSATRTSTRDELASVPKGAGRMKQERSQLNVRLPTTLKRQASAKAVLEGRDIGEVVEALLREYLER
jgi:hypothetical protein